MKKRQLYALWGGMFILCAGLGFIPEPEGTAGIALLLISLCFYIPPALLLYRARKDGDLHTVRLVRNLSGLSLLLTVVLLILNFLTAASGEFLGLLLYYVLVIVSSPMICSGYWALSLFLWSCLLAVSRNMLKGKK